MDETSALTVSVTAGAWLLAATFVVAAVAKARDLRAAGDDFASLGIRRPHTVARLAVTVEVAVALALVLGPPWGATAAFALLAAFTTVLVRVVRQGRFATCRCFGSLSAAPVGWTTVARNGALLVLAAFVALA
ncbi:MAG: MauE/DoxX family redox-associated membrane protein [Actinomycetota bacterium]